MGRILQFQNNLGPLVLASQIILEFEIIVTKACVSLEKSLSCCNLLATSNACRVGGVEEVSAVLRGLILKSCAR